MRKYEFVTPNIDLTPIITQWTEQQIIECYWDYWSNAMLEAGKLEFVNYENCLEDFICINWATQIKDE